MQLAPATLFFFPPALQTVSEPERVQVTADGAREGGERCGAGGGGVRGWEEGEKVRVQLDKGSLLPRLNGKCHSSQQRVGRESARAADEDG